MASVGQACAQRVVCGFQVGSSMRCAQKMHFWAQLLLFVPVDGAVGAGVDDLRVALGLLRVDHHDAVFAGVDGAVGAVDARRVLAVLARHRQVGHVVAGVLAALAAQDVHPAMAVAGLGGRVAGPVVVDELVLVGHKAVVAVVALGHVDDLIPLLHLRWLLIGHARPVDMSSTQSIS